MFSPHVRQKPAAHWWICRVYFLFASDKLDQQKNLVCEDALKKIFHSLHVNQISNIFDIDFTEL